MLFVVIPGWLIALITFPGVIMHEIAHRFFCDLYKVPVFYVDYFGISESTSVVGRVLHGQTPHATAAFFIGIGPLIINSLVCMLISFPYGIAQVLDTELYIQHYSYISFAHNILMWLAFSIGFNAVPSNQDMKNISLESAPLTIKIAEFFISTLAEVASVNYIGPIVRVIFAYVLMRITPYIFLSYI